MSGLDADKIRSGWLRTMGHHGNPESREKNTRFLVPDWLRSMNMCRASCVSSALGIQSTERWFVELEP